MEELPTTKNKINLFLKDKLIVICSLIIFLLNLSIWLILYMKVQPTSEPIPLHYNIYFGIDLIGSWYKIYYIPGFGMIIFFINLLLSYIIYKREKIISYFLIFSSGMIQIIFLATGLLITQQYI